MDFAERLSIAEQQYRHAEWKLHFTERLGHGSDLRPRATRLDTCTQNRNLPAFVGGRLTHGG